MERLLPNSGPVRAFLRKSVFAIGAVFTVAVVAGCGGQKKGVEAARQPTVPVVIATVSQRNVPLELHAIGNVQPYSTVQIRSQVSAQIDSLHFNQGQEVKKGDLLFGLDRRQLEADLKKAEGMVAKDEAQLANAQTKATRYTQLFKEGVVARQDYDAAIADADAGRASLAADKAAVDN